EDDGTDVRRLDDGIDQHELGVGEFLRHLGDGVSPGEGKRHDRVEAALGEIADRLLALPIVLRLEILVVDAGLGLDLLRAVEACLVERLVELSTRAVDDRRLDVGGPGRTGCQERDDGSPDELADHDARSLLWKAIRPAFATGSEYSLYVTD